MGDDTYDDFDDRADLAAADEIIRWLREDNERLRVELDGERRSGERGRAWSNEQKARIERLRAKDAERLKTLAFVDKERHHGLGRASVAEDRIEAALILLPEQPEAAMNVLRGEE